MPLIIGVHRVTWICFWLYVIRRIAGQMPKAFDILQDVVQHTLSNLHDIQKSLIFWQSKAEV